MEKYTIPSSLHSPEVFASLPPESGPRVAQEHEQNKEKQKESELRIRFPSVRNTVLLLSVALSALDAWMPQTMKDRVSEYIKEVASSTDSTEKANLTTIAHRDIVSDPELSQSFGESWANMHGPVDKSLDFQGLETEKTEMLSNPQTRFRLTLDENTVIEAVSDFSTHGHTEKLALANPVMEKLITPSYRFVEKPLDKTALRQELIRATLEAYSSAQGLLTPETITQEIRKDPEALFSHLANFLNKRLTYPPELAAAFMGKELDDISQVNLLKTTQTLTTRPLDELLNGNAYAHCWNFAEAYSMCIEELKTVYPEALGNFYATPVAASGEFALHTKVILYHVRKNDTMDTLPVIEAREIEVTEREEAPSESTDIVLLNELANKHVISKKDYYTILKSLVEKDAATLYISKLQRFLHEPKEGATKEWAELCKAIIKSEFNLNSELCKDQMSAKVEGDSATFTSPGHTTVVKIQAFKEKNRWMKSDIEKALRMNQSLPTYGISPETIPADIVKFISNPNLF